MGEIEGAGEVYPDHVVPVVGADIGDGAPGAVGAGVVDQYVDCSESGQRGLGKIEGGLAVGHVDRFREDFDAAGASGPGDRFQQFSAAGGDGQIHAGGGQFFGDGDAHSAAGAGDEGGLAAQIYHIPPGFRRIREVTLCRQSGAVTSGREEGDGPWMMGRRCEREKSGPPPAPQMAGPAGNPRNDRACGAREAECPQAAIDSAEIWMIRAQEMPEGRQLSRNS